MPIRYKYKEIDKLLRSNGWYVARVNGSHFIYQHEKFPVSVPVPRHKSDLKPGTVNNIFKISGLKNKGK